MNPIKIGIGVFIALLIVVTGFQSFYTVNPGERGIVITAGQIVGDTGPGISTKVPYITQVPTISTRDAVVSFDNLTAYTRDQQTATVSRVSINYRIDPARAKEIYERFGSSEAMVEQLLSRRVNESLERVFGQYNAITAVQERTKLGVDFSTLIKSVDGPLVVTSVQVENFSLPEAYEQNINDQLAAEVKVKQAKAQAEQKVIEAQAQADSELAIATAKATATKLAGDAEAAAIKAKGDALRENPTLIDLTKAERWDGKLPTTMLPGDTIPFINVSPAGAQ